MLPVTSLFFSLVTRVTPVTPHEEITCQLFQICISIKSRTIVGEELLALLERNLTALDTLGDPYLQLAHEFLGVVLHIIEHLGHRLAINHLVDVIMVVLHTDMNGSGVAKEVVHIAKYLLIGSHEEHTEIIRFALAQGVTGQDMRVVAIGGDVGYLSGAVASDVLQRGTASGALVEPWDRHKRE